MFPFAIGLVTLCASYLLMVSVCVSARMSKSTKHRIRWPIVLLGFLAMWAILRTFQADWAPTLADSIHGIVVVGGAVILKFLPRLST